MVSKNIVKRKVNSISPVNSSSSVSYNSPSITETLASSIITGVGVNLGDRLVSSVLGNRKVEIINNNIDCNDIIKKYESGDTLILDEYNKCKKII